MTAGQDSPTASRLPPVLGALPRRGYNVQQGVSRSAPQPPRSRPGTGRREGCISRPHSATTAPRPVSASTAATAARRARIHRQNPQFLVDVGSEEALLPRPLPPGISYVAQYTPFDELIDKKILTQEENDKVHLGMDEVRDLYHAKCRDQRLMPNRQREARFMQLVSQNCRGVHFVMRENGLGDRSARCLSEILAENRYYSVLDLSGNRLRDLGAEQLAALLEVNDSLVHLAIKSNDIGARGAEHLARALSSNITLTSLDLSGLSGVNRNHLGTQGALAFGRAMERNSTLAILNLGANGLGNEGLGHMAHGLEQNQTLTELDLGSNNLGWEACTVLGPLLQSCNIQVLNLERNELRDKGVTILAQALRRENEASVGRDGMLMGPGCRVCSLNISHNGIRAPGFRWIADMVGQTRRIHTLRLDGNEPGEMAQELATALKENRSISYLSLCRCDISDESAVSLGEALNGQPTLTRLELSDNVMGNEGTAALATALRKNRCLRFADLANNKVGDRAGLELADMLAQNLHLQHLGLRQNNIREAGDTMADKLRYNTSLLELDFAYNDFSYKSFSTVAQILQRNNRLWKSQAAPRLMGKIDSLKGDEAALYGTEEEILQEIKRRETAMEKLADKREAVKRTIARLAKEVRDLEEDAQGVRHMRLREDEADSKRGEELRKDKELLEKQKKRVDSDVRAEEQRCAKFKKEQKKIEDEIKFFIEAEDTQFAPLLAEQREAEQEEKDTREELKRTSDRLVQLELELKPLTAAAAAPAMPAPAPAPAARRVSAARQGSADGAKKKGNR
eukprot:TRINITY_DN450_c0_g1_i1.p1 TRINITY_DN450_c0_g1~~TRINITY_DN450_c0_g1_i1.p1  ORF type:complete len:798 (+),score=274.95 TRINITY_DN450_c0_g1_i1:119-2512(+)